MRLRIPGWLAWAGGALVPVVVVIVARELAITGLRLIAASKNLVLAAEGFGKHKTISQIAAIIALLVMDAYGEWWPWLHAALRSTHENSPNTPDPTRVIERPLTAPWPWR